MVSPVPLNAIAAPKLATVVARQIEDQVVALGWPVGEVLGSEADLLERFGVSRAVLREAVRIVEHTGAARMRRGPGGGLVVAAPNRDSITTSINIWFSYVGVTVGEMFDARLPLMIEAMRNAATRQPQEAIRALQQRIEEMDSTGDLGEAAFLDLDNRCIAMSDNPAVVLFAATLSSMLGSRLRGTRARIDPPLTDHDARAHLAG
ncbi:MAG TPA: GntR family transcriptional regulator, partial [Ilumatobacter sp.]|nr:GntR family transcriptional regulator [Ilumatobacter sp.]